MTTVTHRGRVVRSNGFSPLAASDYRKFLTVLRGQAACVGVEEMENLSIATDWYIPDALQISLIIGDSRILVSSGCGAIDTPREMVAIEKQRVDSEGLPYHSHLFHEYAREAHSPERVRQRVADALGVELPPVRERVGVDV